MWKQILDILHTFHIGFGSYIVLIVTSFIGTNKNMVVPKHDVSTFYMNRLWRSYHFFWIYLVYNILNSIQVFFSIWKNIRFYKDIVNNKCYVPCKNLVTVFYQFWSVHFNVVLLEYLCNFFHFL